jgi:two-component system sensor histidine kinase TctE
MTRSLRRTLLAWLLLPLLAIVPATALFQYGLALKPTRDAFDQSLHNAALSVAAFVRWEDGTVRFEMNSQAEQALRTDQFDTIYYAVLGPDGRRVAGDPPLEAPPLKVVADTAAFYDATVDGEPVRVVARGVACGEAACQVRVGETLYKRHVLFRESLGATVAGLMLFAVATIATIVLATRQALRPLRRLGDEVGVRSLDDLRPVDAADAPTEVHGLVDAVNRLIGRVREGSLAQQAFLADAAHQLRTPLAALKNEAELILAEPHPPDLRPALQRLNEGAARAARMSTQLLALARSDSAVQATIPNEPLDLAKLASDAAQEWVPRAIAAGADLGFDLQSAPVVARRFLLRELLGNLIHNAIEHAGAGARVTVRTCTRLDDGVRHAVLEVEDDGPGIAPDERARVFERFQRGSEARGAGSGLGLAIVRDIALAQDARVEIVDPPGGRGVTLRVRFAAVEAPDAPRGDAERT